MNRCWACGLGLDSFLIVSGTPSSCPSSRLWSARFWSRACYSHPHSATAGQEGHPHRERLTPLLTCRRFKPASLDIFYSRQGNARTNCLVHVQRCSHMAVHVHSTVAQCPLCLSLTHRCDRHRSQERAAIAKTLCQCGNMACCGSVADNFLLWFRFRHSECAAAGRPQEPAAGPDTAAAAGRPRSRLRSRLRNAW